MLGHESQEFLSKLEEARNGTKNNRIIPDCASESLASVEADKLLHIYDKADAVVRSIMKKINATTAQ
jgi:hypothetical protein